MFFLQFSCPFPHGQRMAAAAPGIKSIFKAVRRRGKKGWNCLFTLNSAAPTFSSRLLLLSPWPELCPWPPLAAREVRFSFFFFGFYSLVSGLANEQHVKQRQPWVVEGGRAETNLCFMSSSSYSLHHSPSQLL